MSEVSNNPIRNKTLTRDNNREHYIGRKKGKVKYISEWQEVEGSKGATVRTWKIEGIDLNVDGADIKIEKSGWTPIQLVKAANVVIDTPEFGKGYCCVMAPGKEPKTNYFDSSEKKQMVWRKGMIIVWVTLESMLLTEFESPAFSDDMFINISEDQQEVDGHSEENLAKFRAEVNRLKELVS